MTETDVQAKPATLDAGSGQFATSEGTLYISQPFRSKTTKRLRALVTFTPRKSHFDIGNESSGMNEFRGFFSLFWISIFIWAIRIYVTGIESSGRPLELGLASMFSQDAITLALSDAVLILATASFSISFATSLKNRWFEYFYTGMVIQHIFQTLVLFVAIKWTFDRHWPWVQSGFFTLHTLVLIMKIHSYMTVNGTLQNATIQSDELLVELRNATRRVGGWEKALEDAEAVRRARETAESEDKGNGNGNGNRKSTSEITEAPPGATKSYTDIPTANALRRRLTAVSSITKGNLSVVETQEGGQPIENTTLEDEDGPSYISRPHPLTDHPDPQIAALAKDYSDFRSELTSPGPEYVTWPHNITVKNFVLYYLFPTLVYELEYPRTDRIRPIYVFEKTVATFGTFALLYTVTETFIMPYIPTNGQSVARSLLDLALPFMIAYLLLFFIIFECICNAFAELSYFADRQFYEDWWNSTSWDEFSRKWNKPVHAFLLRHVYAPTVLGYGLSKTWAMTLTFLLSACVHELVMLIVTQKFRMYLFIMQLVQIPLILLSRVPVVKRNKMLGNVVFWFGLYAGFPLLCVAYVTY